MTRYNLVGESLKCISVTDGRNNLEECSDTEWLSLGYRNYQTNAMLNHSSRFRIFKRRDNFASRTEIFAKK